MKLVYITLLVYTCLYHKLALCNYELFFSSKEE
jgi:hypothetical protein